MKRYLKFIGDKKSYDFKQYSESFINDLDYYDDKLTILSERPTEWEVESRYNTFGYHWFILKSDRKFKVFESIEITLDEGLFDI